MVISLLDRADNLDGHTSTWQAADLLPSRAEVCTFPQAMTAASTKEKNVVAVRINGETLHDLMSISVQLVG